MSDNIQLTPYHVLAAIAFEARRIAGAVDMCAASNGQRVPDISDVKQCIETMARLAATLSSHEQVDPIMAVAKIQAELKVN